MLRRLGELGLDIPDIPRHGSGYAKDVPEDTMRNAARICVHCMFTTRPDLLGVLREALVDGTFHKGPQQVRFADSPVTPAGTPASTPHRQTHRPRPSPSPSFFFFFFRIIFLRCSCTAEFDCAHA